MTPRLFRGVATDETCSLYRILVNAIRFISHWDILAAHGEPLTEVVGRGTDIAWVDATVVGGGQGVHSQGAGEGGRRVVVMGYVHETRVAGAMARM